MICQLCSENFEEKSSVELKNHVENHFSDKTEEIGFEEIFKRCFPDGFERSGLEEEVMEISVASEDGMEKTSTEEINKFDQYCRKKIAPPSRYGKGTIECNLCHDPVNIANDSKKLTTMDALCHIFKHLQHTFVCPNCYYETSRPMNLKSHLVFSHFMVRPEDTSETILYTGIDEKEFFGMIDKCYEKSPKKLVVEKVKSKRLKRRIRPKTTLSASIRKSISIRKRYRKILSRQRRRLIPKKKPDRSQKSIPFLVWQLRKEFSSNHPFSHCRLRVCPNRKLSPCSAKERPEVTHVAKFHLGKKLFSCELCPKEFYNYKGIENHITYTHKNKKSVVGNYRNCTSEFEGEIKQWLEKCFGEEDVVIIKTVPAKMTFLDRWLKRGDGKT